MFTNSSAANLRSPLLSLNALDLESIAASVPSGWELASHEVPIHPSDTGESILDQLIRDFHRIRRGGCKVLGAQASPISIWYLRPIGSGDPVTKAIQSQYARTYITHQGALR